MEARKRIEEQAETEKIAQGKPGFAGKSFVDIGTIRKALVLRDEQGVAPPEIEKMLGLRKGAVAALGRTGVVEVA